MEMIVSLLKILRYQQIYPLPDSLPKHGTWNAIPEFPWLHGI